MKPRTIFALGCLIAFALGPTPGRADDRRFSSSLNVAESAQTGLGRLSSDEVAVLDALVRHDLALVVDSSPSNSRPAQFSQRLSAEERRNAGLTKLNETEIAELDADVERFAHPSVPGSGPVSDPNAPANGTGLTSVLVRRAPEIHGTVSFMVGAGSHGYSEYGGAINVTYYDPAHHFALDVGYSEIHWNGGNCGRLYPASK